MLYLSLGEKTVVLSKCEMKVTVFERLGKPETGHLVSATHAKYRLPVVISRVFSPWAFLGDYPSVASKLKCCISSYPGRLEFTGLESEVLVPSAELPRAKGRSDVSKWKCPCGGNILGDLPHKTEFPNPN